MISLFLALVVGTWNGNWFPSGRAEHRATDSVEAANIAAAGKMLSAGIARADPQGREDVILALCEIRNREVAERLVAAIGRPGLRVASVSAYRRRDRFDQQQNVILTTFPVVDSRWANWRYVPEANPPRGFASVGFMLSTNCAVSVFSVHLKSNYGSSTSAMATECRQKRTNAINEFLRLTQDRENVILAGDFNADKWCPEFSGETIFADLERAGFVNLLAALPPGKRGTHPNRKYGDSTLDYIMVKGLVADGEPFLVPNEGLSDHCAVFARVKPPATSQKSPSKPRPTRSVRTVRAPRGNSRAPFRTP